MVYFKSLAKLITIKVIFMFLCWTQMVRCSHFKGGLIMWRPKDQSKNPLEVSFTIRVAWKMGRVIICDKYKEHEEELTKPGDMVCFSNCRKFPKAISPFSVPCTDFSVDENWSTGERTFPFEMPAEESFKVGYTGSGWMPLLSSNDANWRLETLVNMTKRSDNGKVNSSPRSTLTPVVRLQKGCKHKIKIPVSDPDGDILRCRWAVGTQECAGVCMDFQRASMLLKACEITDKDSDVGRYAAALMIEDFSPDDPTKPLSKIPLQFVVDVFESSKPCNGKPEFVDDTPKQGSCIGVPFGLIWNESIIAKAGGSDVSITVINTVSPPGLVKSSLYSPGAQLYAVNVTWTAKTNQVRSEFFCYTATDSTGLPSTQSCTTLLGGVEAPLIVKNATSPSIEVLPTQATWTIQFDKTIIRPSRNSTFVKFHDTNGKVVTMVDTTSANAKFLNSARHVLEITTKYTFIEKQDYYITLDRGIVTGVAPSGQCAPESFPKRDPYFWRFKIKDVTPPTLTFTSNPVYTTNDASLSWVFNEEAYDTCSLQYPDGSIQQNVVCDKGWNAKGLKEGLYSIFITATDLAGNVAPQVVHKWHVRKV